MSERDIDDRTARVFWMACVPLGVVVVAVNPTEQGIGLGAAIIFGSMLVLTAISVIVRLGAWLSRPIVVPPEQPAKPVPEPEPPPFRVEDLGPYLNERRCAREAADKAESERRQRLKDRWADVAPTVAEAVELVNAQLSRYAMKLVPDGRVAGFRGKEAEPFGLGATYNLQRDGLPVFDGEHSFVATENVLYVANIGEIELSLEGLTARKVADATAESVKWLLEG